MKKTGNLFELAREQLEKEQEEVTPLEVIDRAVEIRRKLDEEEVRKHNKSNKKWYKKTKSDKN